MTTLRRAVPLFALLVLALVSLGCPPTTTPTTPPAPVVATPPQITVANAVNALAQAVNGAVTSSIAARDAGKADASDVATIESFASAIAHAGKDWDAELRSTDDWATQRTKILVRASTAGLATLKAHISPGAQALVAALVVLVNQILTAVGGIAL